MAKMSIMIPERHVQIPKLSRPLLLTLFTWKAMSLSNVKGSFTIPQFWQNLVLWYGTWGVLLNQMKKSPLSYVQGVPKKTHFWLWQTIEGTRSGLEIKVGWVLQNSGNFLSDEHKNSSFLSENDWEKWVQRCLPPLRKGMLLDHTKDLLLLLPFQWKVRLGYLTQPNLT